MLERTHKLLGNIVRAHNIKDNYTEEDYLWMGISVTAAVSINSTQNRLKGYTPDQLVFSRDMILPIKHTLNC